MYIFIVPLKNQLLEGLRNFAQKFSNYGRGGKIYLKYAAAVWFKAFAAEPARHSKLLHTAAVVA